VRFHLIRPLVFFVLFLPSLNANQPAFSCTDIQLHIEPQTIDLHNLRATLLEAFCSIRADVVGGRKRLPLKLYQKLLPYLHGHKTIRIVLVSNKIAETSLPLLPFLGRKHIRLGRSMFLDRVTLIHVSHGRREHRLILCNLNKHLKHILLHELVHFAGVLDQDVANDIAAFYYPITHSCYELY